MYDSGAPRIGKGRCCRRCNRHPIFIVDIGDNSSYDEPWPSGIFRVGSFFVRLSMLSLLHRSCTFLSPAVWSVRPRPWVHSFDLLAHLEPTTSLATRFDELERTRTPSHRPKIERERESDDWIRHSISIDVVLKQENGQSDYSTVHLKINRRFRRHFVYYR